MTLQVWASAALIVAASVLIGEAIASLGARSRGVGPAVGLAALIIIAYATIHLPGRATTAAVILAAVAVAAAALLVVRRRRLPRPTPAGVAARLITAALAGFGAAIPFIANGTVGLPGVSLDNDTASHLVWTEGLRSGAVAGRYGVHSGYPLGPHSLVGALASGVGIRSDRALTALLIAIVVVTALVAASALKNAAPWRRVVVGVMAGLLYLVAAYYAEGAFKETLLGLMLLGFVLSLEEVRTTWVVGARSQWLTLIPAAVLVAGALYVYSYFAVAWLVLTVGIWIVAEVIAAPRWLRRWRAVVIDVAPSIALTGGVGIILLLPVAGQLVSYLKDVGLSPSGTGAIAVTDVGNLGAGPLSPWEALGIWNSGDFRFPPTHLFTAGQLSAFALAVLVGGLVWCLARRELLLPAAVAACAIVYWRASRGQSPYVTAKALVIAGPVVAVTGLKGLLEPAGPPLPSWVRAGRLVVALAFVGFAAHSSYEALRNEPVWPPASTDELVALGGVTRGEAVLFLGNSDYAPWLFKDSDMSALASTTASLAKAAARPNKPFVYGTALDFDSVDPSTINRFKWVITTNTPYASQAPAAFRLVRQLPLYQLWERVGIVAPRGVLEPSGSPGVMLNCKSKAARAFSRRRGVAMVTPAPVIASLASALPPADSQRVVLRLPAGQWDLSLQYESPVGLEVSAAGRRFRMPAYDDRPGPVFSVGSISSSGGAVPVLISIDKPSALTGPDLVAFLTRIVATKSPLVRQAVPLSAACGRYVDWYRLGR